MSDERCPYGNMPREAGAGHWRDWHRGHGCHLDPEVTARSEFKRRVAQLDQQSLADARKADPDR